MAWVGVVYSCVVAGVIGVGGGCVGAWWLFMGESCGLSAISMGEMCGVHGMVSETGSRVSRGASSMISSISSVGSLSRLVMVVKGLVGGLAGGRC